MVGDARGEVLAAEGAQALELDVVGAGFLDVDDGLAVAACARRRGR